MVKSLKETRQERNVGIRRLSKGAPVAPRTIYQAERGESTPSVETIRKISRFLQVDPNEIAEFKAALEAQGFSELPEEPIPFTEAIGMPDKVEEDREQALADFVRQMRNFGKWDVDRAYRRAFEAEPPR